MPRTPSTTMHVSDGARGAKGLVQAARLQVQLAGVRLLSLGLGSTALTSSCCRHGPLELRRGA
jgi:hypothetical protein